MASEISHVLIVDDEAPILRTLGTYLRLRGYKTSTFENPHEALSWAAENTAHIVLTDIVMEGIDGLEFVRRLREQGCLAQIVVITAFSTLDRAVDAYRLGVSDYLIKPFDSLDEVGEVVDEASKRLARWRQVMAQALAEEAGP
jgi:DNA-binding NtrC family response regulator